MHNSSTGPISTNTTAYLSLSSTSKDPGALPSAMCLRSGSSNDEAAAFAAAHANKAIHRMRQACSTNLLVTGISCLARARTTWCNESVCGLAATASTQSFGLVCCPINMGRVAIFIRSVASNATYPAPLLFASASHHNAVRNSLRCQLPVGPRLAAAADPPQLRDMS